jgi:hypothetical protein
MLRSKILFAIVAACELTTNAPPPSARRFSSGALVWATLKSNLFSSMTICALSSTYSPPPKPEDAETTWYCPAPPEQA